jgi:glucose/arabinose dehydrogenase
VTHVLKRLLVVIGLLAASGAVGVLSAQTGTAAVGLPNGFHVSQIAAGFASPTTMALAPDGRIFVTEQGGRVLIVKNGAILAVPFLTLTVDSAGERGLLGLAFDPTFATNHYVYVYYTVPGSPSHNRLSRFTANGDVADPATEAILADFGALSDTRIHNSGALHFGPDGKLYVAVGDNGNGANAQKMDNRFGKILRFNDDGTIPSSNPFYGTATGDNRAIWALGLRNPFTFAFKPGSSRMFINDVGLSTWEEINDGVAGANYGWPTTEGPTSDPRFKGPIYAYDHNNGCAITGGAFYNPTTAAFPASYLGDYFFADYCNGVIRQYDIASDTATGFATGTKFTVDLDVADDGSLYYLDRGAGGSGGGGSSGSVNQIVYTGNQAPTIGTQPASQLASTGHPAVFSVEASGSPPFTYQWFRGTAPIAGETGPEYTLDNVQTTDNGAHFHVEVTNSFGTIASDDAILTVTTDQPPNPVITGPADGTIYHGGQEITYAGTATDNEDGNILDPAKFTWQVDFHHATHIHPFMPPTSGATGGTFQIPSTGHTDANVFYRILLTVKDSAGLSTTTYVDLLPKTVQVTINTNPPGMSVQLDASPMVAPVSFTGVVGVQRTIEARGSQVRNGKTYDFASWSDGGAGLHTITTPNTDTTYTATFREVGTGLAGRYYDNADLTGAVANRLDGQLNFDWGTGPPVAGIGADTFSTRWVGMVRAPTTGTYTFYTQTDEGVRLWVNGTRLIDNWAAHTLTENSGTIPLTAGVRYSIRMEYYDGTGAAVAKLLWSGPSVAKSTVPKSELFPVLSAHINFQPSTVPGFLGYLLDSGLPMALRPVNGERYGWNVDSTALAIDRNAGNSPDQRYDSFIQMQRPANPNAKWEILVPNGTYKVHIVAGDPTQTNSTYRLNAEGVTVVNGVPTPNQHWVEGTANVTVADGRLTITNAAGAANNKICYIDIN